MPPTSTGKWVSRVAATGGGRTYRGQVPVNWYAALIIIVILGLASIVFARYEYQHPHHATTVQPAVGSTEFAGLSFNICGTVLKPLPESSNASSVGVSTVGEGVLAVSPKNASEAGDHATLGSFFDNYPSAGLSATRLEVEAKAYVNGQKCATGTPDAGKPGYVKVMAYPNPLSNKGTDITANATTTKIGNRELFTVGFVPKGTTLARSQSVADAVISFAATVVNGTTTTAASATSTTAPSSTSSTAATTTTTTAASTTTTTKG